MSLGWALRGYIGGGPLGAMIPGALVALCLCLLLDRDGDEAAVIAAFGAIGYGFGGQETYGQTIGLAFAPETRYWGLAGLGFKGAVWGLLGGAMLAVALVRQHFAYRHLVIGLLAMGLATQAGWKLINEPKLIYFSNPVDKPRPELWAGLGLGAIALLAWLQDRVVWGFAKRAALLGGIGFAAGGAIQVFGRQLHPHPLIGYWKVMELLLGALLGAASGWCAWRWRLDVARRPKVDPPTGWAPQFAMALVATLLLLIADVLPQRAAYTVLGIPVLLLVAWYAPGGWQAAVTATYTAFSLDYREYRPEWPQLPLLIAVVVTSVAVAWLAAKWRSARPLFLLLLWTSVGNSLLKSFVPPPAKSGENLLAMEALFVLMAVAATYMMPKRTVS